MFLALLLCSLVFLLVLYHNVRKSNDRWKKISQYPGEAPWPLLGNGLQLGFDADEASQKLMALWRKHGKQNYRFSVGSEDWLLLSDPDDIGHVIKVNIFGDITDLKSREEAALRPISTSNLAATGGATKCPALKFILSNDKKAMNVTILNHPTELWKPLERHIAMKPFFGDSLASSEGERWKSSRKLMTPSFQYKTFKNRLKEVNNYTDRLFDILDTYEGKGPVDLYRYLKPFMYDIICAGLMGVETNLLDNPDHIYLQASKETIKIVTYNYFSYWRNIRALFVLTPMYWEMMRTINIMRLNSTCIINDRREKIKQMRNDSINISETDESSSGCLLDEFLLKELPNGQSIPDEFINDEVTFHCFTGHYPTTVTVSHALYCLAKYPEIQKKVIEEQRLVLGDNLHKKPTLQELNEMKYLEAVIKETIRVIPTVTKIGRTLHSDVKFKDGRVAPAGTSVFVFYEALYQNPKVFSEPDLYKPERHLEIMHPFSLVPFSAGPRNCIGFRYAMLAMKATLSNILRRYEVIPGGRGTEPQFVHRIVTESKNGLQLRLRTRNI